MSVSPFEVAPGDSLMLTVNRRGPELRATNGELVRVSSLDGGAIRLEDGRTLPPDYHEFTHGYAVTPRSQSKTVDTVIISADAMKKELLYVAAGRGRSEIAVVNSDREQLRESVGLSTMSQPAIELARKQLTVHNVEKGHSGIDLVTNVNRQAGQQIGEQHSFAPAHAPEPQRTPHIGLDHDLGGLGLGLGH
jgi:hypothetical protein